MKIGQIYTFNYQSKGTGSNKKYAEPVRIKLTDEKQKEIINGVNAYADKAEKDFDIMVEQLEQQKYFKNLERLAELDAERKERSARARKNEEQKELEILVEGQYEAFVKKFANEEAPVEKVKTITDLFFRNYSLSGITLDDDGANKALLTSKSISKTGSRTYKFITLNPVIVDKSELFNMEGFDYA